MSAVCALRRSGEDGESIERIARDHPAEPPDALALGAPFEDRRKRAFERDQGLALHHAGLVRAENEADFGIIVEELLRRLKVQSEVGAGKVREQRAAVKMIADERISLRTVDKCDR